MALTDGTRAHGAAVRRRLWWALAVAAVAAAAAAEAAAATTNAADAAREFNAHSANEINARSVQIVNLVNAANVQREGGRAEAFVAADDVDAADAGDAPTAARAGNERSTRRAEKRLYGPPNIVGGTPVSAKSPVSSSGTVNVPPNVRGERASGGGGGVGGGVWQPTAAANGAVGAAPATPRVSGAAPLAAAALGAATRSGAGYDAARGERAHVGAEAVGRPSIAGSAALVAAAAAAARGRATAAAAAAAVIAAANGDGKLSPAGAHFRPAPITKIDNAGSNDLNLLAHLQITKDAEETKFASGADEATGIRRKGGVDDAVRDVDGIRWTLHQQTFDDADADELAPSARDPLANVAQSVSRANEAANLAIEAAPNRVPQPASDGDGGGGGTAALPQSRHPVVVRWQDPTTGKIQMEYVGSDDDDARRIASQQTFIAPKLRHYSVAPTPVPEFLHQLPDNIDVPRHLPLWRAQLPTTVAHSVWFNVKILPQMLTDVSPPTTLFGYEWTSFTRSKYGYPIVSCADEFRFDAHHGHPSAHIKLHCTAPAEHADAVFEGNIDHRIVDGITLRGAGLKGVIASELAALPLHYLDLSRNSLKGTLPFQLYRLAGSLRYLNISNNPFITGTIPREWGAFESLQVLDLSSCGLTGTIPTELAKLEHLRILRLNNNQLLGTLPPQLGTLGYFQRLSEIDVSGNAFRGTLPPAWLGWPQWTDCVANERYNISASALQRHGRTLLQMEQSLSDPAHPPLLAHPDELWSERNVRLAKDLLRYNCFQCHNATVADAPAFAGEGGPAALRQQSAANDRALALTRAFATAVDREMDTRCNVRCVPRCPYGALWQKLYNGNRPLPPPRALRVPPELLSDTSVHPEELLERITSWQSYDLWISPVEPVKRAA